MGFYLLLGQPATPQSTAQLQKMARQQATEDKKTAAAMKQPGSAFIVDEFTAGPNDEEPHGKEVEASLKQDGFKGNVFEMPVGSSLDDTISNDDARMTAKNASPKDFIAAMDGRNNAVATSTLNGATSQLQAIDKSGASRSAVNISLGDSKAADVKDEYKEIQDANVGQSDPHQSSEVRAQDKNLVDNACRAFHVNEAVLNGPDFVKGGAQRAKLQQGLIDQVNHEEDPGNEGSTEVKKAKAGYDQAVGKLVSKNVAVDVAAEDSGDVLSSFAENDGPTGSEPHFVAPGDFQENKLSNSKTHTVGAVGDIEGDSPDAVAPFSSPSSHLTRYAFGVTPDKKEQGTSFATPRNTEADATVLGRTNLTVDQANDVIQNKLTKTVPNNGHPVQELDDQKLRAYEASSSPLPSQSQK